MNISGMLRTVALGSLGLFFGNRGVHCSYVEGYISLRKPTTLRDILDYIGKVGSKEDLKEKVVTKIVEMIGAYFTSTDDFIREVSSGIS